MVKGGGLISIIFMLIMLLSPPGIAVENKRLFDGKQFTKQIRLELRVAKVIKHPLLTRGPLDYLAEGGRKPAEDNEAEFYRCNEKPILTDEDALADIAKEVALAQGEQIKELKSKYYCYRFDILNYFITTYQNEALRRALNNGFEEYFISVKNPNPYNVSYLLNQAVFAENKEALNLVAENCTKEDLYSALLNFITKYDSDNEVVERHKKKYNYLRLNYNDLAQAVLHDNIYDLKAVNEIIAQEFKSKKLGYESLRQEYLKALNYLIDLRLHSKK